MEATAAGRVAILHSAAPSLLHRVAPQIPQRRRPVLPLPHAAAATTTTTSSVTEHLRRSSAAPAGGRGGGASLAPAPLRRPPHKRVWVPPHRCGGAVCQAASTALQHTTAGFDEMAAGTDRKFFMVGGKGGVGKTSLSAALATKFAMEGHYTLIVSTDPAHSLSDSFAQDVSGGKPVALSGTDLPLFALEVDPESAKSEFRAAVGGGDGGEGGVGKGVTDFMGSMGLGALAEQLSDLKLGELLDTPPPGLDEAVAIAKVVQILQTDEYAKFTRVVFDTAPTGHTLRLLSLPDFLDASVGKIVRLRQKIASATQAIKSVFGAAEEQDEAVKKLESLQERLRTVRELFRNSQTTEFVIVTIPTMMALLESSRLIAELRKEGVPVKRVVINQILPETSVDCRFCKLKFKDQHRAMSTMDEDPNFRNLRIVESPMFDLEIRGVPALQFLGSQVWK